MKIHIKIGTMPAAMMHLCNKHKEPNLGDHVYVKSDSNQYTKREGVLIDAIKDINGSKLFFAERM